MDDKLISKQDAADMLGVSVKTVERMIADGDLPMYKIRGQCRLMTNDIKTYIADESGITGALEPAASGTVPHIESTRISKN